MAEIASAYVSLLPSARGFGSSAERQIGPQMSGVAKTTGSRFGRVFGTSAISPMKGLLLGLGGLFAISKVKGFLESSIGEAREAQKVSALTAQVIKSTGGAAGISAAQVDRLSSSISRKTGIDDEQISSAQNLLLTFKNIKSEGGIYEGATSSLVDMGAAMAAASGGQLDLKSSTTLVGKALNDPIKGLSALSRVGVTFTAGQQEQIKALVASGNTMKAQKVILRELNSEFGGAAASQATNADKARVAWGNLKEQVGGLLLPVIDKLAGVFSGKVIPAISTFISQMQSGEGAGGKFASIMGQIGSALATVFDFVKNNKAVLVAFVGTIYAIVGATAAWNAVLAVNPISLVVIAIAALVAGLVYAYQNFETFRNVVDAVFSFLKTAVVATIGFVKDHWQLIVSIILGPIGIVAIQVVKHWTSIKSFVTNAVSTIVNFVRDHWRLIVTIIGGPLGLAVALVTKYWGQIKAATSAVWSAIKSYVSTNVAAIKGAVNGLSDLVGKVRGFFQAILEAVKNKLESAVKVVSEFPGKAARALGDLTNTLYSYGRNLIQGFINGIKDKAGEIVGAVTGPISSAIKGVGSLLKIGSPSKLFHQIGKWTMEGFVNGIDEAGPKVLKAMQSALEKTLSKVSEFRDGVASRLDSVKSAFSSLKDSIASTFAGDLFNVSAIAESLTETTFTAAQTVGQAFVSNLMDTKGRLQELLKAFRTLKGWGIPAQFLSQLFASGNSGLILELAGGTRGQAQSAVGLFNDVQSLSNQLGGQVARNQYGAQIDRLDAKLARIDRHTSRLEHLAKDIGRELNGAVSHGHRKAS